jgi:hypothetical protein
LIQLFPPKLEAMESQKAMELRARGWAA